MNGWIDGKVYCGMDVRVDIWVNVCIDTLTDDGMTDGRMDGFLGLPREPNLVFW